MFSEERQQEILDLLKKQGRVLVKDLAEHFGVSVDSIRRDLAFLEEKGLLKRTHGGAIPLAPVRQLPLSPEFRYADPKPWEEAIARVAASYVKADMAVFIWGGRLPVLMLPFLPEDVPLTVVTNSLTVAQSLRERKQTDTYLVGGRVKPSGNITDVLAMEQAGKFSLDVCFGTGGGFSERGVSTATPEVAAFGRKIAEQARRNILLIPHDRFGVDAFAHSVELSMIDLVITDEQTPAEAIARIRERGVEVVVAESS
jgi:DeoR/GlpR family transcriptional regulator of sugar metabolism